MMSNAAGLSYPLNMVTADIAQAPHRSEELIVTRSNAGTAPHISLRRALPNGADMPLLPISADLLAMAEVRPFGVEERCVARRARTLAIDCRAGSRPAGVVLHFPNHRFPAGAALATIVRVDRADGFAVEWVPVGGDAGNLTALRSGDNRLPPARRGGDLVLLAPSTAARLTLGGLRLEPAGRRASAARAAWAWRPDSWRDAARFVAAAKQRRLDRLFVGIAVDGAAVRDPDALRAFASAARASGIAAHAVEGDPAMTEGAGLANGRSRARALAAFQRLSGPRDRLAGIQFDLEPYSRPDWTGDEQDFERWGDAIMVLAADSGEAVDLVVPAWLPLSPEGRRMLDRVSPRVSGFTVMAYRTDDRELISAAEPMLAWATAQGKPVTVALEAGRLDDEIEERAVPAAEGTLAIFPGAPTRTLFLDTPGKVEGAIMYRLISRTTIRASRVSFLGDERRMVALAGTVDPILSAWPAFAGFAFHGLDWHR